MKSTEYIIKKIYKTHKKQFELGLPSTSGAAKSPSIYLQQPLHNIPGNRNGPQWDHGELYNIYSQSLFYT